MSRKTAERTLAWALAGVAVAVGALLMFLRNPSPEASPPDAETDRGAIAAATPPPAPEALQLQGAEPAWETVDPGSVARLPAYKEIVPGRSLVRVAKSIEHWEGGDEVAFEIEQLGATLEGVVSRVEVDGWGNRTYEGLIRERDGRNFRFVVTVGARNTFAYLRTSRGTFELVASGGLGWLMPTAGMDQHVDYSRPDVIGPEADRYRRLH